MTPLELATLKFWNAAVFIRRAPDRSPTVARRILADAAAAPIESIRARALEILKGTTDDREPSSADGA